MSAIPKVGGFGGGSGNIDDIFPEEEILFDDENSPEKVEGLKLAKELMQFFVNVKKILDDQNNGLEIQKDVYGAYELVYKKYDLIIRPTRVFSEEYFDYRIISQDTKISKLKRSLIKLGLNLDDKSYQRSPNIRFLYFSDSDKDFIKNILIKLEYIVENHSDIIQKNKRIEDYNTLALSYKKLNSKLSK